jgi:XTP/dITP diphosphohydrolase
MTKASMPELLLATGNQGKLKEFQSLLNTLHVELRTLREFPAAAEVEETGATFAENAVLKASSYALQTGLVTLADDSGLAVDALNGAPGVFSARYGGEGLTDGARTELLLKELAKCSAPERSARFICVIAIADKQGRILNLSTGKCEGEIAFSPRGTGGFGYDPVFIPQGFHQTFGELPPEIKESISHRSQALREALRFLKAHFQSAA